MILFKELLLLCLLENTEIIDRRHANNSEQLQIIPDIFLNFGDAGILSNT